MKRLLLATTALLLLCPAPADAQMFNVRRLGMGGVILGGRLGGEGDNVAYRAVPVVDGRTKEMSIPIGLLPVLADPPTFNPTDPAFNVFKIANLVECPPWNLQLNPPATPSNDVTLDVSQNALHMNLGDIARVFPTGTVRAFGVTHGPAVGFGIRRAFVAVAPLVEFRNDFDMGDGLRGVLRDGAQVAPGATYTMTDAGIAQAAAALHLGLAMPLWLSGNPKRPSNALYAGARVKLLRGLAYGEADNTGTISTGDTLFSSSIDLRYTGHYLSAQPADGGWGTAFDAGAVWRMGALELGVAADDIGAAIAWKVRETVAMRDSASGDIVQTTLATGRPYTSRIPATLVANAAWHAGRWMLAADVRRNTLATTLHAGLERWLGPVALRAGTAVDENRRTQLSGGLGLRFGKVGIDAAVATNNRNLQNQRQLELGTGFVLHP